MNLFRIWSLRPLILSAFILMHWRVVGAEDVSEEHAEPADAVLFPWFVLAISIFIYYLLSRYARWIPYTGMCFLLGTLLGVSTQILEAEHLLALSMSEWWINIDSEVLLLTFLPGLIYKDAFSLNGHLFQVAFNQCLIFAFPMVLAGTAATALVCYYIFPYDWSFNLAMTAGSILSATDPVAVSALLEAVGAPERLKVHIAGEALLNDGSAIVFFTIFGLQLFLSELNVEGYGEEVDFASGVKTFFRMSLGAVAIGLFFGLGMLMVFSLFDRRLSREESIVEVAAQMTTAYLCYFTAEVAWGTSGVIATLTLGVVVNLLGRAMINSQQLSDDFASLVEHMLNTVLFSLGGLVWGGIIANSDEENSDREFTARDWGYLVVLYLFLTIIRLLLLLGAYPVISRIGLKSSWEEMLFQSYAGLRGAIGIALAISLDNTVQQADSDDPKFVLQTNKLFGFVGGIAFMTLMINATTAGPLLRKLGLADTSTIREKLVETFRRNLRAAQVDDMVSLLATQKCYARVRMEVVQHHVHYLANLTKNELLEAARVYKEANGNKPGYREPNLDNILSSLPDSESSHDDNHIKSEEAGIDISGSTIMHGTFNSAVEVPLRDSSGVNLKTLATHVKMARSMLAGQKRFKPTELSSMSLLELRRLFIELVRAAYDVQVQHGALADREFVAFSLFQSLDLATDEVQRGESLRDWELASSFEAPLQQYIISSRFTNWFFSGLDWAFGTRRAHVGPEYTLMRLQVERAISFVHAHQVARAVFRRELDGLAELSKEMETVLNESFMQMEKAEALLVSHDLDKLETVVSHKFCSILLLNGARKVEKALASGLLKPTEADEILEVIQEALNHVNSCEAKHHEGEVISHEPITTIKEDDSVPFLSMVRGLF